jgi:ubiquinone biosynthesis monooxygenase Coq7
MPNPIRHYSPLDLFCLRADTALRALSGYTHHTRPYPAAETAEADLSAAEKKHSTALMRVNHAGEVSAQALYHGQGLVSRDPAIKEQLQAAATEEGDHLAWCAARIAELNSHTSYLNPLWYTGSFLIGIAAGAINDKYSLGFVAETEAQVLKHLQEHLHTLPEKDEKTAKILRQMQVDEARHQDAAVAAGASELPAWIKKLMGMTAKIMVKSAYYI